MEIKNLVRKNILSLTPYSSARHEFTGKASVFLDANENAFHSPAGNNYNRYPDPLHRKLKEAISKIKGVPAEHIFIGNGSDEPIDILFRVFCEPGIDNAIACVPTYPMYEVAAGINNIQIKEVLLTNEFELDVPLIIKSIDENTKLLFICSPNNPTGNCFKYEDIEYLLNNFKGIIVVDEAYINYSKQKSFIRELTEYDNLVVLQTFSKAWGLAALRVGMAFTSTVIIDFMNRVKAPYNVNEASANIVFESLGKIEKVNSIIKETVELRKKLAHELRQFSFIKKVFHSDANFLLIKVDNAEKLYSYLLSNEIVVRNRSKAPKCENCIRITVGTKEEIKLLINSLKNYK